MDFLAAKNVLSIRGFQVIADSIHEVHLTSQHINLPGSSAAVHSYIFVKTFILHVT